MHTSSLLPFSLHFCHCHTDLELTTTKRREKGGEGKIEDELKIESGGEGKNRNRKGKQMMRKLRRLEKLCEEKREIALIARQALVLC